MVGVVCVAVVVMASMIVDGYSPESLPRVVDAGVLGSFKVIRCPHRQVCVVFCIVHWDPDREVVLLG